VTLGISPRRFEGWEPVAHTKVTGWDVEGRPTAWDTSQDPEWDAEDRAIIHALMDVKNDECPGCGQPLSESLHEDGKPDPTYDIGFLVCMGCVARDRAVKKQDDLDTSRKVEGVYTSARRWVQTLRKPKQ
jgi:hypothetical protein